MPISKFCKSKKYQFSRIQMHVGIVAKKNDKFKIELSAERFYVARQFVVYVTLNIF